MIPGDLASRLRVLLEASVQPLAVAHETPGDLPRFERGQQFTAQILNPLPDGTFRALVAGKTVTLALPDSAKSGDVLELVASEQRGNTLITKSASAELPAVPNDYPKPQLSQTGQLISQLMTGRFGEIKPVPLASGEPLLPTPPKTAAELVPVLQQAVGKSGLFYEAHLQQWAQGKRSLEAIKQEPQALGKPVIAQALSAVLAQSNPEQPVTAQSLASTPPPGTLATQLPSPAIEGLPQQPGMPEEPAILPVDGRARATEDESSETAASGTTGRKANAPGNMEASRETSRAAAQFAEQQIERRSMAERIPDKLMPLVHQQLETLATQQMSWQGQMWPGMNVQMDFVNPDQQGRQQQGDADTPAWRSALQLSLPRMGNVGAMIVLGSEGLSLRLDTDNPVAAQRMKVGQQALLSSLEAAGIKVASILVTEHADA